MRYHEIAIEILCLFIFQVSGVDHVLRHHGSRGGQTKTHWGKNTGILLLILSFKLNVFYHVLIWSAKIHCDLQKKFAKFVWLSVVCSCSGASDTVIPPPPPPPPPPGKGCPNGRTRTTVCPYLLRLPLASETRTLIEGEAIVDLSSNVMDDKATLMEVEESAEL